jgi:hypothetical protein
MASTRSGARRVVVRAGCANNATSPALEPGGYYKDREGVVHLNGGTAARLRRDSVESPAGYTPPSREVRAQAIACLGSGAGSASHTTVVNVIGAAAATRADGGVLADATRAILDGITYRAAG